MLCGFSFVIGMMLIGGWSCLDIVLVLGIYLNSSKVLSEGKWDIGIANRDQTLCRFINNDV